MSVTDISSHHHRRRTGGTARISAVITSAALALTADEAAAAEDGRRPARAPSAQPFLPPTVTTSQAVAVIETELAERPTRLDQTRFDVDEFLDTFLTDQGRLRPAPPTEVVARVGEEPARAIARAERLDELRAHAYADATLRAYGHAVRAWRDWCRAEGVPALPVDPDLAAQHLLDVAFRWDECANDYLRDPETDQLLGRVALATVNARLAGLNKLAEVVGIPAPGHNVGVAEIMRGIRRILGAQQEKKDPIDLDALRRCLAAAGGHTLEVTRSRAIVLARVRLRATTGQLAALHWAQVELREDQVRIDLPRAHRHAKTQTVVVERHPVKALCLVQALHDLRAVAPGKRLTWVFCAPTGQALARQTPYRLAGRAAAIFGGWTGLPDLDDSHLRSVLAQAVPRAPLHVARSRAFLLTGFWTAGRRSNLSALNWRDVSDLGEDGWRVIFRRGKTDQEGRGHTVWLPVAGDVDLCPSRALRAWRQEVTAVLGRPPHANEPVFAALDGAGTMRTTRFGAPIRMSGAAMNSLVQQLAEDAGLCAKTGGGRHPYGAHSLRIGFVTEALRDDKLSVPEVADVTGHLSLDVLFGYRKELNAAKRNPARKLMGSLTA